MATPQVRRMDEGSSPSDGWNATASGSSAQDVVGTKTYSSNAGDSCTWYADMSCIKPRSCYDCLNTLLTSDEVGTVLRAACGNELSTYSFVVEAVRYQP